MTLAAYFHEGDSSGVHYATYIRERIMTNFGTEMFRSRQQELTLVIFPPILSPAAEASANT